MPAQSIARSPKGGVVLIGTDGRELPASLAEQPARAPIAIDSSLVVMLERLATDARVDVEKLERLIAMQERILDRNAKAAFVDAFSNMQPEIPEIDEQGQILDRAGNVQSHYALNEDIQAVLKPILARHGFGLSFKTEWPDAIDGKQKVRIIGMLSHRAGYTRDSEFKAEADKTGSKNEIQALGSSVAYGRRYTTIDLLNIISRAAGDRDDDAQGSSKGKADEPAGFPAWWATLESLANDSHKALSAAWDASSAELKNHVARYRMRDWNALKAKALGVEAARKGGAK